MYRSPMMRTDPRRPPVISISLTISLSLSLYEGREEEDEEGSRCLSSCLPLTVLIKRRKRGVPRKPRSCEAMSTEQNHATIYCSSGSCKGRSATKAHQQTTTTQNGSTIIQQDLHKGLLNISFSKHQNTTPKSS